MIEPGGMIRSLLGRRTARNRHVFVITAVGTRIVSGRYPVGDILPNEAEMMSEFDVSRTVLREALKTLEAKGLVEARPRVGTRVAPRRLWSLFDADVLFWHLEAGASASFIAQMFDLRATAGREIVRLATAHRTADHLRMMHYWLDQMRGAADDLELRLLAELELHRTLAAAGGNPFHRALDPLSELALATAAMTGHGRRDAFEAAARPDASLLREVEQDGDYNGQLVAAVENQQPEVATNVLISLLARQRARALALAEAE